MVPLIFVLLDGLNAESAVHMGYLAAESEAGAVYGSMACELPPLSRPVYATLFTGFSPLEAGVTHNEGCHLSPQALERSLFSRVRCGGGSSAAAAYHWMRELYTGEPYEPAIHRLTLHAELPIQNGIFYHNDAYPDDHVLLDAEALRLRCAPDFLLVHTMGVDLAGHMHGAGSAAYRQAVRNVDMLLARYVPSWLQQGYAVVVTSDHGMHADAAHNDVTPAVREVPFWLLGQGLKNVPAPRRQTEWCGFLCSVLGV